jgi:hypothetical protein
MPRRGPGRRLNQPRSTSNGAPIIRERRVTTVARREAGQWRIVHYRGDPMLEKKAP